MSDAADLLERVLACNARFPVNEDGKFALLSECERLLDAYRQQPDPGDALTYAVIRMLRHLRRHAEALALMRQRRPRLPDKAREVDFYELELHYLCGDEPTGDRLLQRLEAGGKLRPSWKRSIERLRARFAHAAAWQEMERLERALGTRQETLRPEHLATLRTVLPAPNLALEVHAFLRERLERLAALEPHEGRPEAGVFDAYHRARLIACAGFGWSGSGAVAAFLSQHRQVRMPFGMAELGYLQGRGDRAGFFAFLQPGALDADGMKRLLATFLVESIVCLRDFKASYSVVMLLAAGPAGRLATLGSLLDDFHAAMLCGPALASPQVRKKVVGAFVQRLLSVGGGSHVLLNNVFLASKLDLAETMDGARFVAVERDARDQYVARRWESGIFGHQPFAEFATVLTESRAAFERVRGALASQKLDDRVCLIRFEDFLADDARRVVLLEWLGLSPEELAPDPAKFDDAVSSRNVGIHQGQLSPVELAFAERELGVYL